MVDDKQLFVERGDQGQMGRKGDACNLLSPIAVPTQGSVQQSCITLEKSKTLRAKGGQYVIVYTYTNCCGIL